MNPSYIGYNDFMGIVAIGVQIPIVAFLATYTFQLSKNFEKHNLNFKYLSLAFILNLFYIILVGIKSVFFNRFQENLYIESSIFIFDFSYLLLFLVGTKNFIFPARYSRIICFCISLFVVLSYVIFLLAPINNLGIYNLFRIINTTVFCSYCILVFYSLFLFFHKVEIKYYLNFKLQTVWKGLFISNALSLGAIIWATAQLLIIILLFDEFKYFYLLGFTISLIAKIFILIGFIQLTRFFYNNLKETVGDTYHDFNRAMNSIYITLKELTGNNKNIYFSNQAEKLIDDLEKQFDDAYSTFTSQRYLIESAIKGVIPDEYNESDDNETRQKVILNNMVEVALILLKGDINKKKIRIKKQFSGNISLICFEKQIIRVLSNLIKNSIDAIDHENGIIAISTSSVKIENCAQIEIADNGIGIPDEIKNKIFDYGFSTKEGIGRGKGLTIVKKFLYQNDASIEVVSPFIAFSLKNKTGGTKVIVKIPLVNK